MAKAQEELAKATLAEQGASQYSQQLQNEVAQQFVNEPPQAQQLDPAMEAWSQKSLVHGSRPYT